MMDKFPKKFEDDEEGYTFLSIGGKLPRIKSPEVVKPDDYGGDSSTIAPEAVKAEGYGHSSDSYYSSISHYSKEELKMVRDFTLHLDAVGPYDLEMSPPKCLRYHLAPLSSDYLQLLKEFNPDALEKYFINPAKFALQQINAKENRNYKFEEIVKVVNSCLQSVYVTFTGEEDICTKRDLKVVWTYDKSTFQANVYTPYGFGCPRYQLLDWRRKPDPAAAG